jgi:hypothetical protein
MKLTDDGFGPGLLAMQDVLLENLDSAIKLHDRGLITDKEFLCCVNRERIIRGFEPLESIPSPRLVFTYPGRLSMQAMDAIRKQLEEAGFDKALVVEDGATVSVCRTR